MFSGSQGSAEGPPRADDELPVPTESSLISAPVEFDAAILRRAVEAEIPRKLWTIDRRFDRCVPKKKVKILGRRLNVVPKIPCTVVGEVTRGAIRMRGQGRDLVFEMPIRAKVRARDVGGILKEETATGSAMAQARIRLDLASDWSPRGTVRLRYNWTSPPGIDFLGQRITFTDQADKELKPIMRKLEASLPRHLSKLGLRPQVQKLWDAGFTSLRVNDADPEVWMRLTPIRPIFDGYSLRGGRIRLSLGVDATTETFVGARPTDPTRVALPAPGRSGGNRGLQFFIPVIADYAQIEPVIQRALDKRAKEPFKLPKVGDVEATFANVTAYGTTGGRIAIGFDVTANPATSALGEVRGRLWLEAMPVTESGSSEVGFERLVVSGNIEGPGGDLLLKLANSGSVTQAIGEAVGQDFAKDRDRLVDKVGLALGEIRKGKFVIRSSISGVETGKLQAFGKGLYLPVRATGDAAISFRPGK
ncbi:MAG: DUF4403 family protein [Novosphingobium sp.]|nr:DUF4403 family protein [Novosphingobium sp.]